MSLFASWKILAKYVFTPVQSKVSDGSYIFWEHVTLMEILPSNSSNEPPAEFVLYVFATLIKRFRSIQCMYSVVNSYCTYGIGEQARLRPACVYAQSRHSLAARICKIWNIRPNFRPVDPLCSCTCLFEKWIFEYANSTTNWYWSTDILQK